MHTDNAPLEFKGLAAVFSVPDLSGDIIEPGAFLETINGGRPKRLLFQHNPSSVIGSLLDLSETEEGLFVHGLIKPDFPNSVSIIPRLKQRSLSGLSIGFQTIRAHRLRRGRRIYKVDLWEISVVDFPMSPTAQIRQLEPFRR